MFINKMTNTSYENGRSATGTCLEIELPMPCRSTAGNIEQCYESIVTILIIHDIR